jgi:hypothetical protein
VRKIVFLCGKPHIQIPCNGCGDPIWVAVPKWSQSKSMSWLRAAQPVCNLCAGEPSGCPAGGSPTRHLTTVHERQYHGAL